MLYTILFPWLGWNGCPSYFERTLTESVSFKDIYKNPILSGDWINYDTYRDNPVPPKGKHVLPASVYCVCSQIKKINFDLYYDGYFWRYFVSEKLFLFIKENGLLDQEYDFCPVKFVSKKLITLTEKPYYMIRFFKFYDELIDIEKSSAITNKSQMIATTFLKKIEFNAASQLPPIFMLKNYGFSSFVFNEQIKNMLEKSDLKGITVLTVEKYTEEMLFRRKNPYPTIELLKERDQLYFGNSK